MLAILIYLGFLLILVGSIALIIAAFRTSIWWGLAVLFISPVALIYVIVQWKSAKGPFLTQLAGFVLIMVVIGLYPNVSVTEVIQNGAEQIPFMETWVGDDEPVYEITPLVPIEPDESESVMQIETLPAPVPAQTPAK